jgi:hypothetical protein
VAQVSAVGTTDVFRAYGTRIQAALHPPEEEPVHVIKIKAAAVAEFL